MQCEIDAMAFKCVSSHRIIQIFILHSSSLKSTQICPKILDNTKNYEGTFVLPAETTPGWRSSDSEPDVRLPEPTTSPSEKILI